MRNIELKARLTDLAAARELARSLATKQLGLQEQTDAQGHAQLADLRRRFSIPDADLLAVSYSDLLGQG